MVPRVLFPAVARFRLDGKVAVVTGGGSGIGAAICRAYAEQGARVVVAEVNQDNGRGVASDLGEAGLFWSTDVTDLSSVQAAVKTADSNLAKTKDELAKVRKRVSDQQQGLEGELARVRGELDAAEGELHGDFKENYLRLSRSMGEESLAPVEGGCCGGCSQTLTVQMLNLLKLDKPLFCVSCGRLLYLPE